VSNDHSNNEKCGLNLSPGQEWRPDLRRGVNLGGWLSQQLPGVNASTFITAREIEQIRDFGFDHVRVPVDETVLYPDGLGSPADDRIIDILGSLGQWCTSVDMAWIADLHRMREHTFLDGVPNQIWNSPSVAEVLAAFWNPLLRGLGAPRELVIDLLNEPSQRDPLRWYKLAEQTCSIIWSHFPGQWFIIEAVRDPGGPATVRAVQGFPDRQSSRVIYGFHFYEPLGFTHQSAKWSIISSWSHAPQQYPGRLVGDPVSVPVPHLPHMAGVWNRERIAEMIDRAGNWATSAGVKLHCGEFGVYLDAPRQARYNWISDVIQEFERHRIGWCYWTYRDMGFGIYCHTAKRKAQPEYRTGVDQALLKVLLRDAG
jgi:endoglucanase